MAGPDDLCIGLLPASLFRSDRLARETPRYWGMLRPLSMTTWAGYRGMLRALSIPHGLGGTILAGSERHLDPLLHIKRLLPMIS